MRASIDGPLIIALIFCALALGLFQIAGVIDAMQSTTWPTATGTVLSARSAVGSPIIYRSYSVQYRYKVEGKFYENNRVQLGTFTTPSFFFEYGMEEFLKNNYSSGKAVKVYYKPDYPADAVLEPGLRLGAFVPMPFIAFLLFLAGWIVWSKLSR